MDEMYGIHHSIGYDYSDKGFMSPDENLMIAAAEYGGDYTYDYHHHHQQLIPSSVDHRHRIPAVFESSSSAAATAASESASFSVHNEGDRKYQAANSDSIKARIASHPSYPKLLDAYIDCQKVGATPEIASLLDEIRRDKDVSKPADTSSLCFGFDPELDAFMETYCEVLVKYKTDLSRPFNEATSFLNTIQTQLSNLICKDNGALSSDEEASGGETEMDDHQTRIEDRELKDRLLRQYGNHINSLKLEFSKKRKKGKLPKEARQTLLEWWNVHYKWPYPTEGDKMSLAELTGLDQKQINNWFINQRKRHWKPSENMHLAMMDSLSARHFCVED
ncbi:hypothetical protein ABFX02_05G018000 [Erythranthe guttata]